MSATSIPSEIANGASGMTSMTPDGRYIAFESNASNLNHGDGNGNSSDVWVRDRVTRVATLVSGGSGGSYAPSISPDGRYVSFHSFASFSGADNNGTPDIYRADLLNQSAKVLVSVTPSGQAGNGVSDHAVVTPDGRYVAFRSSASNLVPNDTNGRHDVFVRDLQTGVTDRVSIANNGDEAGDEIERRISISSDGRYVAFESRAILVAYDYNNDWDVFVRDRWAGTTTSVSLTPSGTTGNLGSYFPSMTPDGRFVAFHAWSSDLVPGDVNGQPDIFLRDRSTGQTSLVSVTSGGGQSDNISDLPTITSDGRYIAFRSLSTTFIAGGSSGSHIFVKDRVTGALTRASISTSGAAGNAASHRPITSSDGKLVAFETDATNLVPNDVNGHKDVVLRNITTGQTTGITTMTNTAPTASVSVSPTSGNRSTSFQAAASGSDPDGDPISSYEISWGDGQYTYGKNTAHSYSSTGAFAVRATACDQFGLCSPPSSSVSVQVSFSNRAPVASLTVSPSQGDTRTSFSANMSGSSDPDRDSLSYEIDWGDGTVVNASQGQHTYERAGNYEVRGQVTDSFGAYSVDAETVRVCEVWAQGMCTQASSTIDDTVGQCYDTGLCPQDPPFQPVPSPVSAIAAPILAQVPKIRVTPKNAVLVVNANVLQAYAEGDPGYRAKCTASDATKTCDAPGREKRFAMRVAALSMKGRSATGDGMGKIPDIVLLQEARLGDAQNIANYLTKRFNKKFEVAAGRRSPLVPNSAEVAAWCADEPTMTEAACMAAIRIKADPAIVYNSAGVRPTPVGTFVDNPYSPTERCEQVAGVFIDQDGDRDHDCRWAKWKRQYLQGFVELNPSGQTTGYRIAVASVHFVTKSHFASDAQHDTRTEEWVRQVAQGLITTYDPARFDAYAIGGDLNNHRCVNKFEPLNENDDVDQALRGDYPQGQACSEDGWWATLTAEQGYTDAILDRHRNETTGDRLVPQYADGNTFRRKRIDYIFSRLADVTAASHDITCGAPTNCRDFSNAAYYSDHRLVWGLLTP
ncbi:MAG TPA: PKD domain-containing protein [Actinomycetota bacterium]|nr:PKD domain-containing protein [Actinomycetota bacterium]